MSLVKPFAFLPSRSIEETPPHLLDVAPSKDVCTDCHPRYGSAMRDQETARLSISDNKAYLHEATQSIAKQAFVRKIGIAAAVALGVSLLIILSLFCETAPAALGYIGYIPVESIEKAHQISQDLLKNKLVGSSFIVPISLQNSKETVSQTKTISSQSHLLLIETSAELIPNIKFAVAKAYKDSSSPQFVFSPASSGIPYLSFTTPEITDSTELDSSASRLPITNHPATGGAATAFEAGEKNHKMPIAAGKRFSPPLIIAGKRSAWLDDADEISVEAVVGKPFNFLMSGNQGTGYSWTVDEAATSPSLRIGSIKEIPHGDPIAMVGARSVFSLQVTPTQVGEQTLILKYTRPWDPTDNPVVKTVHITAVK